MSANQLLSQGIRGPKKKKKPPNKPPKARFGDSPEKEDSLKKKKRLNQICV